VPYQLVCRAVTVDYDGDLIPGAEGRDIVEVDHAVLDPGGVHVRVVPHRVEVGELEPRCGVPGRDPGLDGGQGVVAKEVALRPAEPGTRVTGIIGQYTVGIIRLPRSEKVQIELEPDEVSGHGWIWNVADPGRRGRV
jgi:hypothetical protein